MHGVSELLRYAWYVHVLVKIEAPQAHGQLYELCIEECKLRILFNLGCSRVDMARTQQSTLYSFSVTRALRIFAVNVSFL